MYKFCPNLLQSNKAIKELNWDLRCCPQHEGWICRLCSSLFLSLTSDNIKYYKYVLIKIKKLKEVIIIISNSKKMCSVSHWTFQSKEKLLCVRNVVSLPLNLFLLFHLPLQFLEMFSWISTYLSSAQTKSFISFLFGLYSLIVCK